MPLVGCSKNRIGTYMYKSNEYEYMQSFCIHSFSMRGKRLSSEIVKLIYSRRDQGMSERNIAEDLSISKKAVHLALHRRAGGYQQQLPKLGRPKVTTPSTDRAIAVAIKRRRFSSYRELGHLFNVSKDTIRRSITL
jgi:DNA-binding GntR family transcriptional regulator